MLGRRQMLGSAGLAGLFGAVWPAGGDAGAAQSQSSSSEKAMSDIATAITDLRKGVVNVRSFPELSGVREQQRTFLRATGKFPDYIEVGVDVWQGIYDWHVRWQQPITLARDPNGRYVLSLVATAIILRADMAPGYIGAPYDAK